LTWWWPPEAETCRLIIKIPYISCNKLFSTSCLVINPNYYKFVVLDVHTLLFGICSWLFTEFIRFFASQPIFHHCSILIHRCAVALTRQHFITSPVFELSASFMALNNFRAFISEYLKKIYHTARSFTSNLMKQMNRKF